MITQPRARERARTTSPRQVSRLAESHWPVDRLTSREREVLKLLCERLTDREIADVLFISTRTVESHVANILCKLAAVNRRDAATIATRLDLPLGIVRSRPASTPS